MLIIQYIIEISYPVLKLLGFGVAGWLYIKNRKLPFFWLMISMASVVLVDIVGLFFPIEIYIVALDRTAKTLAYDAQRGLYVLHYLFLLLAGISFLRSGKTPEVVGR